MGKEMSKIFIYVNHGGYEGSLYEYNTIEEAMDEYESLHKYASEVKFIEGKELKLTAREKSGK